MGKSIIDFRKLVPEYFGNNREFQVFLRAFTLVLSTIKADTDNFISNLLNPLTCKARLLPLLANYVGYDYNPRERVITNRWITKLYPLLIRNRGSELGLTLAIALAICLTGESTIDELELENNFSIEIDTKTDKYGRTKDIIRIYTYYTDYIPILKDMIELVRPAGIAVEFIPTQNITSSETVVLTDEISITKYDYITGKLVSINGVDIYVQNSWPVLIDEHAIKHFRWKHMKEYVWGRIGSNLSNASTVVKQVLGIAYAKGSDVKSFIESVINSSDLYNIVNSTDEISENIRTIYYRLAYTQVDQSNYFPEIIKVTAIGDVNTFDESQIKIEIEAILYTDNNFYIDTFNRFMLVTFGDNIELNMKDLKVASDNTWGWYNDTGIEPFAAIPGLAPYDVSNKGNLNAELWNSTGISLIDGKFYDNHGNDLNRYVDPETGNILYGDGEWRGEYIKETRIYKKDANTGSEVYTGMYFDVSNPAKVKNTYYKLLDDGVFSGFYLSEDDKIIYSANNTPTYFKLVDDVTLINGVPTPVWKVYDSRTDKKYNWHVNTLTRRFEQDDEGQSIIKSLTKHPFSSTTYLGKKAYIINKVKNSNDTYSLEATAYYVNNYGDIIDPAGNIILSKKDRYKISDSTLIGFSEVHDTSRQLSTYDGTSILQREWSFMKDDHVQDIHGKNQVNDFSEYERVTDPRYKFDYSIFDIGNPIREYTGTELIRFISNEELKSIKAIDGSIKIPLFITDFDRENANGILKINLDLPLNYSLADVFKNINIRYEKKEPNDEINEYWDIYIDWVPNMKNAALFNLNDLENPIHFIKCGKINQRTLKWTHKPILLTPRLYDGTTAVYTQNHVDNFGGYQEIINEIYTSQLSYLYLSKSNIIINNDDSFNIKINGVYADNTSVDMTNEICSYLFGEINTYDIDDDNYNISINKSGLINVKIKNTRVKINEKVQINFNELNIPNEKYLSIPILNIIIDYTPEIHENKFYSFMWAANTIKIKKGESISPILYKIESNGAITKVENNTNIVLGTDSFNIISDISNSFIKAENNDIVSIKDNVVTGLKEGRTIIKAYVALGLNDSEIQEITGLPEISNKTMLNVTNTLEIIVEK